MTRCFKGDNSLDMATYEMVYTRGSPHCDDHRRPQYHPGPLAKLPWVRVTPASEG